MNNLDQLINALIFLKATQNTANTVFNFACSLSIESALFSYGYRQIHHDRLPSIISNKIEKDKIFVIAKIKNHHLTGNSDRILIALPFHIDITDMTHDKKTEEKVRIIIIKPRINQEKSLLNLSFDLCNDKNWDIKKDMKTKSLICLSRIIDYEDLDERHLLPLLR